MLLMLHAATYARLHNACSVAEHIYYKENFILGAEGEARESSVLLREV